MQCPRCAFENLPGQTACFRCGSALVAEATVDVHPPRATAWSKRADGVRRRLRRVFRIDAMEKTPVPAAVSWSGHVLVYLVLAPVPGLLQLYQGRFREVWFWSVAWLFLILGAGYLYGLSAGLFLIGLAAGLHGWLVGRAWGVIHPNDDLSGRLGGVVGMVLLAAVLYWLVGREVASRFTGGYSPLAVPGVQVEAGDYLVGRPISAAPKDLARGSFVVYRSPDVDQWRRPFRFTPETTVGQVIGRPGETVTLDNGTFLVNGRRLDFRDYPVPRWLWSTDESFSVPRGCYFISAAYHLTLAPGVRLMRNIIEPRCLIHAERIQSRLTYRWLPVGRRGPIPLPADPVR